ncbi:hypothetical protein Mal15_03120 [Stieleria maiorica]|uniref:GxxExxY protein n=1 Tax=Stieleria maiorica TaxID=2795974 RepID=A0A5B9M9S7_9BACT|nr:GxxExxY protein [Stieleria maiorica]QEF96285.1 hypothetical protein Mal15_03120 [Stieleria maiorica]
MAIDCNLEIDDLEGESFDEIDSLVMQCAYASQNRLGRLCDESVYERDLAIRLKSEGICDVYTQVPVYVSVDTYQKTFRLDLVAGHAIYELKTVDAWTGAHDAQVLTYAMIMNVRHGKLLNFRPPRVQGRLRYNRVPTADRFRIQINDDRWAPVSAGCERLHDLMCRITDELGMFLDRRLYRDALVHFHGGDFVCARRLPLVCDDVKLGSHRFLLHHGRCAFIVTALTRSHSEYEPHLKRLIEHSDVEAIQWINLNRSELQFITLN